MIKKIITILIFSLILFLFWNHKVIAPTTEPARNLPLAEQKAPTISILAVGDILLSRHVGSQIDKAQNSNLPFEKLQPILSQADITFGNLECPLSDSNVPIREGLVFRCLTKYVPGLLFAGFDVLATANNHSMDQGIKGLEFTIDYLKSQNILPAGTSLTPNPSPIVWERVAEGRVRVGFLAYSYSAFNDGKNTAHPQIATMNIENLKSQIFNLKSEVDVVIVSMHAGLEYTRQPNQQQMEFARAAIDAGADAVIGHHPHWIQEVEIYPPISPPVPSEAEGIGGDEPRPTALGRGEEGVHRGIIFYSLGNFVFDQEWSRETKEGLMIKLQIADFRLQKVELMPVVIENFCCPRLADEEEKKAILKKIKLETDTLLFPEPVEG